MSGRSPRGRRSHLGRIGRRVGSISAWAEEPPWSITGHPQRGRSPRGRRSLLVRCRRCLRVDLRVGGGAGGRDAATSMQRVDLRVGGGADRQRWREPRTMGRSPRGRRSHSQGQSVSGAQGSISAWAEEPPPNLTTSPRSRVGAWLSSRVQVRVAACRSRMTDVAQPLAQAGARRRWDLQSTLCRPRLRPAHQSQGDGVRHYAALFAGAEAPTGDGQQRDTKSLNLGSQPFAINLAAINFGLGALPI